VKIILDECVPRRVANDLPHDVSTVRQLKLAGLDNGALLKAVEDRFDVFLTVDQNLQYQQNFSGSRMAIVVLVVPSNRYDDIKPLISSCISTLSRIKPGEVVSIPR
jgi:predicted nuclease of predicted toxin-antitoxin system